MLGRSVGLTYDKLRHLGDDPLPDGVYSPAEAAVVRYAQRSTRGLAIDASTYRALAEHFSTQQIIDICLNVGLSQITNRFNATFLPGVDEKFMTSNEEAYAEMGGPPIEYAPKPAE
jgi:alkylhydroperoxidase family enzyme